MSFRIIQARYPGRCDQCKEWFDEGEEVAWDPASREILCATCHDEEDPEVVRA